MITEKRVVNESKGMITRIIYNTREYPCSESRHLRCNSTDLFSIQHDRSAADGLVRLFPDKNLQELNEGYFG